MKELLGHITDTERIMCYRLLRVGRGDQTPLAGFNENDYVQAAQTNNLPMEAIIEDFKAARNATITLIQNLPAKHGQTKETQTVQKSPQEPSPTSSPATKSTTAKSS